MGWTGGNLGRQTQEEGRFVHIGTGRVPGKEVALRYGYFIPGFVAVKDIAVFFLEHGWA